MCRAYGLRLGAHRAKCHKAKIVFVGCHARLLSSNARTQNEKKKKRLKISSAVVLETRHRQYVLVSLPSSNFIGCTLFLCFIFFSLRFHITFFFFAALSAGNCVRIYFKISVEFVVSFIAPLFAITFLHSKPASMAWGESIARVCDSIYLSHLYIWSAHMWVCDLHDRAHCLNIIIMYYIIKCRKFYDIFIYIYENRTRRQ